MRSSAHLILLVLTGLFLTGCFGSPEEKPEVAVTPKAEIPSGLSQLIFTRDEGRLHFLGKARVRIDHDIIGSLSREERIVTIVPEGTVLIEVDTAWNPEKFGVDLYLESGKSYYFKISDRSADFVFSSFGLLGSLADDIIHDQDGNFQIALTKVKG